MKYSIFFKKIKNKITPLEAYQALGARPPAVLLESARVLPGQGRYSLAAGNPSHIFQYCQGQTTIKVRGKKNKVVRGRPLLHLKRLLASRRVTRKPGDLSFCGGAVGFAGYEAKKIMEPSLSTSAREDLGLPWMYFLLIDEGVLFDHQKKQALLFCVHRKAGLAGRRLSILEKKILSFFSKKRKRAKKKTQPKRTPSLPKISASVNRREFISMVQRAKSFIRQGDIFQANLSQRLSFSLNEPVETVYEKLKKVNPSSFFGILDAGHFQILSGSPERLLKLEGDRLQTRPIAGTRARGRGPQKDRAVSLELLINEKERAEHIMLVDLERNDLGRVAEYGSVRVDELMTIENYSHVKHLVSAISADLKTGLDAVDAFSAFFPGGTITGAPKIRSMQIIDQLEPVARGPYTGSLGYFSFTGDMDFNIIIRSLVVKDGVAHLQVGAGIVADSDPEKEYDETLYKAEAVLTALFGAGGTRAILQQLRKP